MGLVRLFITKDRERSFVDVPQESAAETQVEIEMSGGTVYHACVIQQSRKRAKARLHKRLY